MTTPYRTPAEIAAEIQPSKQLLLARLIVAPVSAASWIWTRFWPWLVPNAIFTVMGSAFWFHWPLATCAVQGGANLLSAIVYMFVVAYRWAKRELEASELPCNERKDSEK